MKGRLTLIPTPLDIKNIPHPQVLELLKTCDQVVVEEHKDARRRWLAWGLPRETIENFILHNEHTAKTQVPELIKLLQAGKHLCLFSDGGMPAFMDPGKSLVRACHKQGIKVTSAPFDNSVVLALALSGMDHEEFYFCGILPREREKRLAKLKELCRSRATTVFLDTPYRLERPLGELDSCLPEGKLLFMAMDLAGFAISAGSACSSGKVKASRVLKAMGYSDEVSSSAVRVSLGLSNTEEEITQFADTWIAAYKKFLARSGRTGETI